MPANAIVGRVGGDEFIIFLPGVSNREEGGATALRLVRGIGEACIKMRLKQSCSIGITQAAGNEDSFRDAYKRADKALYHAKTHGKDGFFWYEDIGVKSGE